MPGLPANVPNYDFGTATDYAAWDANTTLYLCNVPWNSDYRDIVRFENQSKLDEYLDKLTSTETLPDSTYARINAPIRIQLPFSQASKFNYIRVKNGGAAFGDDEPTSFYYFITNVEYTSGEATTLNVQLDVWQTFGYGVRFGRCYIDRGHLPVAAENGFADYGQRYLSVPEGLDTGSEYSTIASFEDKIMSSTSTDDEDIPMVMVLSTVDLTGELGDDSAPKTPVARPHAYAGVPAGMSVYILGSYADYASMMNSLKDKPWAVEGIYSVSFIPSIKRYHDRYSEQELVIDNQPFIKSYIPLGFPAARKTSLLKNWRNTNVAQNHLPSRYSALKKFWTFPYMAVEITVWNGSSLILRPEKWDDPDMTILERGSIMAPGQRAVITPRRYGGSNGQFAGGDNGGEHINMSVTLDAFLTIPVMNNAGALALAQNARSMAFERSAAEYSQQRAILGANLSYDQASNAIGTATQQTDLANRSAAQSTEFNNSMRWQGMLGAAANIPGGIVAGAAAGPVGAAAAGGMGLMGLPGQLITTMQGTHAASVNQAMAASTASEANRISNSSSAFVRDTNRDYAMFAARGDYQNTIAAQNARVQDTLATQPSVKGAIGGDVWRRVNDLNEVSVRVKMVDPGVLSRIGEYWLNYGYAFNNWGNVPDGLHVMSHFTYWKLQQTYLKSAPMPESYRQAIRGIFESGVTVWRNPDDIGNIDPVINKPLGGVWIHD